MYISVNLDNTHALESFFNHFNASLFDKALTIPKLTLCHLTRTDAQFIRDGWTHPETGETYHELQLDQELTRSGKRVFCEHLVHLMVHLWQYEFGQSKPTKHNHNTEFVTIMRALDFESDATQGRSLEFTPLPGGHFMRALTTAPELTLLLPSNSSALLDTEDTKKPGRSGKRDKWGCPNGHYNGYFSKAPRLKCCDCDQTLIKLS